MKHFRFLLLLLCVSAVTAIVAPKHADAQCAMCSLNAENSTTNGNSQGKGLNDGILFLLAIPYLIAVGVGILWYKKYRKSQTKKESPLKDFSMRRAGPSSSSGQA